MPMEDILQEFYFDIHMFNRMPIFTFKSMYSGNISVVFNSVCKKIQKFNPYDVANRNFQEN